MADIYNPNTTGYTIRLYKKLTTNPSIVWANTYEMQKINSSVPNLGDFSNMVAALTTFEGTMALTDVQFDRAVVSSHVPDGEPYDPTTFVTIPIIDTFGTRVVGGDEREPLNIVLFVRKDVEFGRTGKLYLRRSLSENDVTAPSGEVALSPNSAVQTLFYTALQYLDAYVQGDATQFRMAMLAQGQPIRLVSSLTLAGARVVKYNNRYYDRA